MSTQSRLEVGKTYPTRDGRMAKVVAIRGGLADIEYTPVKPIVVKGAVYADSGKGFADGRPYDGDLILPYRVRRVLVYEGPEQAVKLRLADLDAKGPLDNVEKRYGIKITESRETF